MIKKRSLIQGFGHLCIGACKGVFLYSLPLKVQIRPDSEKLWKINTNHIYLRHRKEVKDED